MADFTKLTAATETLASEVGLAVAALGAATHEDPAVQVAVDAATAAVTASVDKLAAAIPPPPPPSS